MTGIEVGSKGAPTKTWDDLPDEVIGEILSKLNHLDRSKARVCRRMKRIEEGVFTASEDYCIDMNMRKGKSKCECIISSGQSRSARDLSILLTSMPQVLNRLAGNVQKLSVTMDFSVTSHVVLLDKIIGVKADKISINPVFSKHSGPALLGSVNEWDVDFFVQLISSSKSVETRSVARNLTMKDVLKLYKTARSVPDFHSLTLRVQPWMEQELIKNFKLGDSDCMGNRESESGDFLIVMSQFDFMTVSHKLGFFNKTKVENIDECYYEDEIYEDEMRDEPSFAFKDLLERNLPDFKKICDYYNVFDDEL